MGEDSKIQWTDHTFNPWVGCQRVSPGCEHCYAESYDKRVGGGIDPADKVKKLRWGPTAPRVRTSAANWRKPLAWNKAAKAAGKRARVFCASLADVFEDRPELVAWRSDLFGLIDVTPNLDWLLLTKRPENIPRVMPAWHFPRHNVWLGTTVEDPLRCERIAHMQRVPAVVRFLSCEPLLAELRGLNLTGIDWVIIGGESGGKARPFDVAWARSLVAQCRAAGVAPFVKQLGSRPFDSDREIGVHAPEDRRTPKKPDGSGGEMDRGNLVLLRDHHGGDPAEWPADLRMREFPK